MHGEHLMEVTLRHFQHQRIPSESGIMNEQIQPLQRAKDTLHLGFIRDIHLRVCRCNNEPALRLKFMLCRLSKITSSARDQGDGTILRIIWMMLPPSRGGGVVRHG